MGHVVVMVAINSLTMVVLYGPLALLLLPVADVPVPFERVAFVDTADHTDICHFRYKLLGLQKNWTYLGQIVKDISKR